MAAHLVLLSLMLGSYIHVDFFPGDFIKTAKSAKIFSTLDTIVFLLMAFIMDQVNGPQYTVWANRKFVGKNKEEVEAYILYDRNTLDSEVPELNGTEVDSERP